MHDLTTGVTHFRDAVFPAKAQLFAWLTTTHTPATLFIGCSDARVVPELITSSEPGELFVIRTAGNLVPAYGPGADGVAASIDRPGSEATAALIRANVVAQQANLATHPAVARALSTGAVTVEGWVFDIGTGAVTVIDPAGGDRTIAA